MFQHSTIGNKIIRVNPFKYARTGNQTTRDPEPGTTIHNVAMLDQFKPSSTNVGADGAPTISGFASYGRAASIIAEGEHGASAMAYCQSEINPQEHHAVAVGIKTIGDTERRYIYRVTMTARTKFEDPLNTILIPWYGFRDERVTQPDSDRTQAHYCIGGMLPVDTSNERDSMHWNTESVDAYLLDAHGGTTRTQQILSGVLDPPHYEYEASYLLFGYLFRNTGAVGSGGDDVTAFVDITAERIFQPDQEVVHLPL